MYDKDKHIENLESTNAALAELVSKLKKRKMEKTNENTVMWRNKYYYVKKENTRLKSEIENLKRN